MPERRRVNSISLRFIGNDLDPTAITAALGAEPSRSGKLSDPGVSKGHWILKKSWEIRDDPAELGTFSPKILELLSTLSPDLHAWLEISQRFPGSAPGGVLCSSTILYRSAVIWLDTSALAALSERSLNLTFVARE